MQYQILGGAFPAVVCRLADGEQMVTERGSMLWMTPNVEMETSGGGIGKMFSRAFAGESMMRNTYTARGEGMVAFGSSFPGKILALDIAPVGPEQTSDEHKATIFAKDSRFPYHIELTRELIDAAERAGIQYEVDVFTPGYGTDCDPALQAGYDVRHAAIGHGCLASHGYERTHIDSLREMYGLMKAYALGE